MHLIELRPAPTALLDHTPKITRLIALQPQPLLYFPSAYLDMALKHG
jgi:hypothetical protein